MGAHEHHTARDEMGLAWFAEFAAGRRSIRRYVAQPLAPELIACLLQAAVTAPSAHNRQPWRFLVIATASTKETLARAMGAELRVDRRRDGDASAAIETDVARSHARITGAPVLVLVCMSMADMDHYADARRNEAERLMATQGTSMAAHNLLLAAHAAGLGACWMCAPLFCPDAVSAALALPEDWEPQALVTLGIPADSGKPYRRRGLGDVTRYAKDEA